MRPLRLQAGFTIIELMITVAISAILLGIGVPSFRDMILAQEVKTTATEIHLALVYARSEAIKRAGNIDIVPDDSSDWSDGWQIKTGSTVLKDQEEVNNSLVSGPAGNVVFNKLGRATSATNFEVSVAGNDRVKMRCISVSLSGRAYTQTDHDTSTAGCQQ